MGLTWFITGASRGFGLEVARLALDRGDAVVATARRPEAIVEALDASDRLLAVALDVADEAQAEAAVAQAVDRFGSIDVLVNNAGRGLIGAVEEASPEEIGSIFTVNVYGLLTVTRAVLPVMRAQRSGRIINLSSVGGISSRPGLGVYAATKFGVEAITEALHGELEPLGISVSMVEPGAFRTDFLDSSSLVLSEKLIDDYAETSGAVRDGIAALNHTQRGDPRKAAQAIVTIATAEDPPLRLPLGSDAVARVEDKVAHVAGEIAAWRELACSTDADDWAPAVAHSS